MDTEDPWQLLRTRTGLWFGPGGTLSGWGTADGTVHLQPEVLVAAELESTQRHPDTNVLKYWPWLEERPGTTLILVHVFGRWSLSRTGNRSRLAGWVARKIGAAVGSRFAYCRLDIGYPEADDQFEAIRATLRTFGHSVPD